MMILSIRLNYGILGIFVGTRFHDRGLKRLRKQTFIDFRSPHFKEAKIRKL